jgi:signal transduction histidine kinase
MDKDIIRIQIENELDVVLAYKRAMQLSGMCGLATASQTKFATAVSEICRNVLEHVGQGQIKFTLAEDNGRLYLESFISDRGRGIPNLDQILNRPLQEGQKGSGLINSRKLVDSFVIRSDNEKGTRVQLRKAIPSNHPPINSTIIKGWIEYFDQEKELSPYAEIKNQNMQLIELLEELRLTNIRTEAQLAEITRLNTQLQTSNREINKLLHERNLTNQELLSINQSLDQFAHVVSHDLKAPLYNIIALSSIIEECLETGNQTEAKITIGMLNGQATQLDKLITDILLYSTTGRHNLPRKEVNLNWLIQRILVALPVSPQTKLYIQPDLPTLLSEEIYLQQVFGNLISNALKYTDKENGIISVTYRQINNLLEFAVTDNGPGIPLADQERIFRIFETSSLHRNTSSGIGLSIVDKIIKLKGTAIWVESKGWGGATFKFTWPASELVTTVAA